MQELGVRPSSGADSLTWWLERGEMVAGSYDSGRGSLSQPRIAQINEQELKLAELRRSKGPFDRAVRALTTNIREAYENIILENLPRSESIEQQLWRLHYSFIEEFRARLGKLKAAALAAANVPNKKKAVEQQKFERVGGQYKCFLDEATGFYHGLIAKLGAKHGLSGKLSSSSNITEISSSNDRFRRCQCVCHRCYIYLGDLSRYKELHLVVEGRTPDWYVAANYYRQASALWPVGGNPHNQLGVLATYAGDNLQALYHYLYSLAVPLPFTTARANAKLLFEKNQHHNSQLSNSPEEDVAIDIQMAQPFESHTTKSSTESHKECPLARLQRRFRVHFITIVGLLFNKSGLEEVSELSKPLLREAQLLLSQDNTLITSSFTLEKSNPFKNQAFSVMQLVVLLILSIHNVGPKKERSSCNSDGPEISPFVMQAIIFALQFTTVVLQHCTRTEEPCCSHLFPAIVVFCNWLASYPDFVQQIQGDEDCEKSLRSFGNEVCILLSKCLQQVCLAKGHDNDCIAFSEKEGQHGTETILWEDKELSGIVSLKCLDTSEIALKSSMQAKSGPSAAESACIVRMERLTKALTFLGSIIKSEYLEHEITNVVSKFPFGLASGRASSERNKYSQSSGASVRTRDGSLEPKTQGPSIVQRSFEISLASHCRREDQIFLKSKEQKMEPAGHLKSTRHSSGGTILQQSGSELCDNNPSETIVEDPVRCNVEHKDDGALGSAGRGLSLGDWVKAPNACNDDNVDPSPAFNKRSMSRPGLPEASQQAHIHSSAEESFIPSLSFKLAPRVTPKPPRALSCSNLVQSEAGEPRGLRQPPDLSRSNAHVAISLNLPGSIQVPIDLDCKSPLNVEKDAIKDEDVNLSQIKKRRFGCHEPLRRPVSDGNIVSEATHEEESTKRGHGADIEPGQQSSLTTTAKDATFVAHVSGEQERSVSIQVVLDQSVQTPVGHMIVDDVERADYESIATGDSKLAAQEEGNQYLASSAKALVDAPKAALEDCYIGGQGKKRKHETLTPLPSSRCQHCQGVSPGEGASSEKVNWCAPQSRKQKIDVNAGFMRQRQGWGQPCKDPHLSASCCSLSELDGRMYWLPASSKRLRVMKEWECEEDYSWLDTYTHVVPRSLSTLAHAMSVSSFSFSEFGVFREYGASANGARLA